jgi:hypothetical protein
MKIKAQYVSVWDDGTEIRSNCFFDDQNKTVEDIINSDLEVDGVCENEFVEYWTEEGEKIVDRANFINLDIGETWEDKQ